MRKIFRTMLWFSIAFGFNPMKMIVAFRALPRYLNGMRAFRKRAKGAKVLLWPMLDNFDKDAGNLGEYFYQDLWAAQKIFENNPKLHHDIGSRLDGFLSHLLVFRSVTMIDIRPLDLDIPNLSFIQDDATLLEKIDDNSVDSISSLHAAEHFGLGGYGDPIDPNGHLKFMRSLSRVLAKGGYLYFSVPTGYDQTYYNMVRIISPNTVMATFSDLELVEFNAVLDGRFIRNADMEKFNTVERSCGIYLFTKP